MADPKTFTLTPDEARAIQGRQVARYAKFGRQGPRLRALSVAAPLLAAAVLFGADFLLTGWTTSLSTYFAIALAYIAGLATFIASYTISARETARRMLQTSNLVWLPRTVTMREDGLLQSTAATDALFRWTALDDVERCGDVIHVWSGHLLAIAIPERAFAHPDEVAAFADAVRQSIARDRPAANKASP